jgi:hypothetical protein
VERQTFGSYARALGRYEFADRADVDPDRVPNQVPKELNCAKRLGGVGDFERGAGRGLDQLRDGRIDAVEVDDQQRSAVPFRERGCRSFAKREISGRIAVCQNCSKNASICSWATPAASKRPGSSSALAGGVTNISGAASPAQARSVQRFEAAGTSVV